MSDVAVVIPAYNEAATIRDVVSGCLLYCSQVFVVDDGSSDGTGLMIADLPVHLLRNAVNVGKGASLWRGMQQALTEGAQTVITLDADGQHRPDDLPRFLEQARCHPGHIIIGSRLAHKSAFPRKRYYANKFAGFWISWAAGYPIPDSQSGFRLYPSELLRRLDMRHFASRGFVFESEILIEAARCGFQSVPLPIAAIYQPNARGSHFRPFRDITRITRMVTWKLVSRGFYPQGIVKAFLLPRIKTFKGKIGMDGLSMLALSNLMIVSTGCISLLWLLRHVSTVARITATDVKVQDIILVLGSRLIAGSPTQTYRERLQRAAALFRRNPQSRILILGGQTDDSGISEAQAGRTFLRGLGVSEASILVEDSSRHTLENLRNARVLLEKLDCSKAVLVTSRHHLTRASIFASGLGIEHISCAAEDTWSTGFRTFLHLLREAYYLHWYHTGRIWSTLTKNKKMLNRIT